MDEIDVETITNQAEKFSWLKGKVNLEVVPSSKESSKWLFIKGEHLILKRFSPDQSVVEVDFSTIEFWIEVHSLPLDRQSMENLLKIGSIAGCALETDFIGPNEGVWRRYIRVRVEVDVNCPLVPGFPLERDHLPDLWIPFNYEKLGNFCFGCGLLGHD